MCRYPKTGVPLTAVRRHGARAAISSRAVNCARPNHVDGSGIATWPGKTDPHGKVSDPCIRVPDHRAGSRTLADTDRTPRTGPGPLCVRSGPPSAGSRDPGTKNTQALIKARWGPKPTRVQTIPCTLLLPAQAETRCCHVAYCPWHKPAGGAWRKASGPRGAAFIADKARHLSIPLAGDVPSRHLMSPATPLAGDVPPQHLICPVHSADGRRLGHPAGGVPVHSIGRQCARAAAYAILIITRTLPRKQRRISIPYALWTLWRSEILWATQALDTSILFPPFCPWAHVSGLSTLVRAPFSYKRGGTQRKRVKHT
jgi:hypothetical protein